MTLQRLGGGQGWIKAGVLGFAGSGKTYTMVSLAIGARQFFGLEGPIVMVDTEGGAEYIARRVREETGTDLVGLRSRAFSDLLDAAAEALKIGASFLIVDSITHVWRELCLAHLSQLNTVLAKKKRPPKTRLGFEDWNSIKERWSAWPDLYLNAPMHIGICGRAGFEWDFEEKEDARGNLTKELIKTGTKMKVESEFGFEPSLLWEMERIQLREEKKLTKTMIRRATVLKDRFAAMDGATCDDPTFDFFLPHVQLLVPGAHAPVDVTPKTDMGVSDEAEDSYQRERRERVILCERIQAAMLERWPGQTTAEKKRKVQVLKDAFGTSSWTEVETRRSAEQLRAGLMAIETIPVAEREEAVS